MNAINVFTPDWSPHESYGRVARELESGLSGFGLHVNRIGNNTGKSRVIPTFGGVVMAYPTNMGEYGPFAQRGPRIALTMFESTLLPPGWADVLNTFHAVIVPSKWLVEVFKDSGVKVPVEYCPLGISKAFQYVERPKRKPYTFLAFGDRGRRKGWHIAGFSFMQAFEDSSDVKLIFKCQPNALPPIGNKNIEVIDQSMTDDELAALYGQADCMIFPTAGEGFGLPPREFAATGGTVITTNFGGTADDLPAWGLPIDYTLINAWPDDLHFGGLGQWAEPNQADLAVTMRHVYQHQDYYRERGVISAQYVHQRYNWQELAQTVYRLYEEAKHAQRRVG